MSERRDIADLIANPSTPDDLRRRLAFATEMQAFAIRELALPDNGSYRTYVDVGRDFVSSTWSQPLSCRSIRSPGVSR